MSVPKISVVIPTYNVESYIAETLDSLLNQPVALHEIILINDGSTDGTLAVLEAGYANRAEVKVVTQENQGVGAARRNGLAMASGDYVFFVIRTMWSVLRYSRHWSSRLKPILRWSCFTSPNARTSKWTVSDSCCVGTGGQS